jgi:hypothetical protein
MDHTVIIGLCFVHVNLKWPNIRPYKFQVAQIQAMSFSRIHYRSIFRPCNFQVAQIQAMSFSCIHYWSVFRPCTFLVAQLLSTSFTKWLQRL